MTNSKAKASWEATASDEGFSGHTTLSCRPFDRIPADSGRRGATTLVLVFSEQAFEEGSEEVEAYVLDEDGEMIARYGAQPRAAGLRGSTAAAARAWTAAALDALAKAGADGWDLSGAEDLAVGDVAAALEF